MQNTANANTSSNRLEILLFNLTGRQPFGINVLKVKEIIPVPHLTQLPDSNPFICGVANLRGQTLSVIDLARAIGQPVKRNENEPLQGSVIITEFNRGLHGFLVNQVDKIIHRDWKEVLPPPRGLGSAIFTSGVTRENEHLIQILDLESVIAEFEEPVDAGYAGISPNDLSDEAKRKWILVVDDSAMARSQTAKALQSMGVPYVMARDGKEALDILNKLNSAEAEPSDAISLLLSDIEMPELDGYSLTQAIRSKPELSNLYILLHTSLNGAINTERAEHCGANAVLTKFAPEELARAVSKGLEATVKK
ncbi:MAG: chemotaxis protein [Gammaproteobacteria bacterium]|nr:chemotaxis protein [Gammaproteobacteria bacterium]